MCLPHSLGMATRPVPGAINLDPEGNKVGWGAAMAWGQPCSLPATVVLELGLVFLHAPYDTCLPGDGQCWHCPQGKLCTSKSGDC